MRMRMACHVIQIEYTYEFCMNTDRQMGRHRRRSFSRSIFINQMRGVCMVSDLVFVVCLMQAIQTDNMKYTNETRFQN